MSRSMLASSLSLLDGLVILIAGLRRTVTQPVTCAGGNGVASHTLLHPKKHPGKRQKWCFLHDLAWVGSVQHYMKLPDQTACESHQHLNIGIDPIPEKSAPVPFPGAAR